MRDTLVKKIRENLYSLVDVTEDLPGLLSIFKEKGIFNEEDVEEIEKIDISFDKKTTFYWTVVKKEDEAFDLLLESFTSSGNDEGVKILSAEVPEPPPVTVEADVTVESTNEEGRHLAENMEKEFDQIESTDQENDLKDQLKGEEEENTNPEGLQVTEEFLKKDEVSREEEVIEISSEESVEIREYAEDLTSEVIEEAESHVQERLEEAEDEVESPVKVEVTPPESPVPERKEVEVKEEVKELEEPKEEIEVVSEPKLKQVSFETPKESPKEFTITKEDIESSRNEEGNKSGKSIVAQNREIFEKSAPKGVKVKYSFRKEDATNSVETPEANKVSSLKNFFQNLGSNKGGSKDDSNAVERRGGNKLGGVHPNRRTVAS